MSHPTDAAFAAYEATIADLTARMDPDRPGLTTDGENTNDLGVKARATLWADPACRKRIVDFAHGLDVDGTPWDITKGLGAYGPVGRLFETVLQVAVGDPLGEGTWGVFSPQSRLYDQVVGKYLEPDQPYPFAEQLGAPPFVP